jgi:toxin YoeB
MKRVFAEQAWEDYQYWLQTDRKITRRIHELIKGTTRSPFEGIGRPEPLRHALAGYWSRRMTERGHSCPPGGFYAQGAEWGG